MRCKAKPRRFIFALVGVYDSAIFKSLEGSVFLSRSHQATFLLIGIGDPFGWDRDELPAALCSLRVLFSVAALSHVLYLLSCLPCGLLAPHPRLQAETAHAAALPVGGMDVRPTNDSPRPGPRSRLQVPWLCCPGCVPGEQKSSTSCAGLVGSAEEVGRCFIFEPMNRR